MKNVQPDTMAMVITQEHEIISHEKAFVKMEAGCVWVYLLENDKRVGVAYAGPSRFAVDAIAETDMGAMGESVIGSLDGIQLFIGPSSLENISKSAESSDLQNQGFQDIGAFTEDIEVTIKDHWNGDDKKTTIDSKEDSKILFGKDSEKTKVLLVLSEEKGLVFTHGKIVYVIGDDNMVSVSKSGVVITNRDGKQLIVGKGGIVGLDNLLDIGPIVTKSVAGAMRGLKGLKSMKPMIHSMGCSPYENVDDFDWKD
ncbi:MAG: hypothetical protein KAJ36_03050 [Candidatus Thorarchaeota archaeon]|nr:hypothetical protein [Candidatus Thorarchaeota archaeon]MCK5389437.1 hypothetical protein [Candidatus Thorarchaeota archaeon]